MAAVVKSSLSTESPPFNPSGRGGGSGGMGVGLYTDQQHYGGHGGGHRSRSTSPYPPPHRQVNPALQQQAKQGQD